MFDWQNGFCHACILISVLALVREQEVRDCMLYAYAEQPYGTISGRSLQCFTEFLLRSMLIRMSLPQRVSL